MPLAVRHDRDDQVGRIMKFFSYHREPAGPPLAEVLVLGVLLTLAWRGCSSRHRHRRTSRSLRAPEEVHTWEGEGGRPLPAEHAASTAVAAAAKPRL
jgi:hypothetical protein